MIRKVVMLGFTVLLGLTLLLWGLSYFRIGYKLPSHYVEIAGGGLQFWCDETDWIETHDFEPGWHSYGFALRSSWLPKLQTPPCWWVFIPLWIPVLVFGGLSVYFVYPFYRRRERARLRLCLKCGYDLTGNVTGVCPECGAEVKQP